MPSVVPPFVYPSLLSTLAFLLVLAFVSSALVMAVNHAYRGHTSVAYQRRATLTTAAAVALLLVITGVLAKAGVLTALAERGQLLAYVITANGLAVVFALSPVGKRIAATVPLAALIGFQGFRLPLELILHTWHKQGSLPIQMTYEGDNWDIVTGIVALVAGALLAFAPLGTRGRQLVAWSANLVGFALLVRVMSIALRSIPGPGRSPLDESPILLPFHVPYTWILPICVAGALAGHIITFRRLLGPRQGHAVRS